MLILRKYSFTFITLIFVLGSCKKSCDTTEAIAPAILKTAQDIQITGLSYLISFKDEVIDEQFVKESEAVDLIGHNQIIDHFSAPILLNSLVKDFIINKELDLKGIIPQIETDSLKPNDLVFIKANNIDPVIGNSIRLNHAIKRIVSTNADRHEGSLSVFQKTRLKLENKQTIRSLFNDMFRISSYFQKEFIEYSYNDGSVENIYPTWYTRNLSSFFGWNIFKFRKETMLWSSFKLGNKNLLFIKAIDRDIFVAIAYDQIDIFGTDFPHKKDLLQSPLAIAVLKTLFMPADKSNIDYALGPDSLETSLLKNKGSQEFIFLTNELLAYARYYDRLGKKKKAREFYSLYDRCLEHTPMFPYINNLPIAEVNYVPDNQDAVVPFKIEKDTIVQFFGAGQILLKNDYLNNPENYDHVQIYLNKNLPGQEIKSEDLRLFQYNYGLEKVTGLKDQQVVDSLKSRGVDLAFSDSSDTTYTLETRIPWGLTGCLPKKQKGLAANLFIGDSDFDENYRKSMVSWVVKSNEYWNDATKYGQILFTDRIGLYDMGKAYCLKTTFAPVIDGVADKVWQKVPFSAISTPYVGKPSAFDSSAKFKTLRDDEYVYFLVTVTDNCKNKAGVVTKDKCWIEDARTGEIVWKMGGKVTDKMPSFFVGTKISLKKGSYNLRYKSDKGHSFEGYYGQVPLYGFYGAQIYYSVLNPI